MRTQCLKRVHIAEQQETSNAPSHCRPNSTCSAYTVALTCSEPCVDAAPVPDEAAATRLPSPRLPARWTDWSRRTADWRRHLWHNCNAINAHSKSTLPNLTMINDIDCSPATTAALPIRQIASVGSTTGQQTARPLHTA